MLVNQKIKIALINPPIASAFARIECTFPNLPPIVSLPILACETERRILAASMLTPIIRVYDRPQIAKSFIQTVAQADILGLSTWFSNYQSAISIACGAKKLNPKLKVVLGGPNAANLGARPLWNRDCIDFVVAGDGEDAMWRLAVGHAPATVPNLWYRDSHGHATRTYNAEIDLNTIAPFDFRHVVDLDLSAYDSRQPGYSYSPATLPVSVAWIRGCPKAVSHGRCGYCSIPDRTLRCMNAENAWAQLRHLRDEYGINSFFEGGDDFSCRTFAEDLANSKAFVSGIHLRGYSGLWRLTDRKLEAFRKAGVSELFVGLETANSTVNKWCGRKLSRQQILHTFSRIHAHGIGVCMPLLFGLPHESRSSLNQSEALASELIERFDNIRMVLISIAVPLIGSPWFSQLVEDHTIRYAYGQHDLTTTDIPDYARLSELSISRFCNATSAQIAATLERLRSTLANKVAIGSFGALDQSDNVHCEILRDQMEPLNARAL